MHCRTSHRDIWFNVHTSTADAEADAEIGRIRGPMITTSTVAQEKARIVTF